MRKINYLAIIAGILAVVSLALPWFDGGFKGDIYDMQFSASLYQISGTVNGMSETTFTLLWFSLVAVAFLVISAVSSFVGSVTVGKKGQLLILMGGILALMSMVVFGAGILNSNFVVMHLNPLYTLSYFQDQFGLTSQQISMDHYVYSWSLNVGFWAAFVAGILAFASLVAHKINRAASTKPVKTATA